MTGWSRRRTGVAVAALAVVVASVALATTRDEPASTRVAVGTAPEDATPTDPEVPAPTTDADAEPVPPESVPPSDPTESPPAETAAPVASTTTTTGSGRTCAATQVATPMGVDLLGLATADGLRERSLDGTVDHVVPGSEGQDLRHAEPRWDATARRVAWPVRTPGSPFSAIAVADVVDRCWRVVTPPGDTANDAPAWSTDGRVGYRSRPTAAADPSQASIRATDPTDLRTVPVVAPVTSGPAWAPDGSGRLAYSDREGLKVLHPSGRKLLLHAANSTEYAEWSPDATAIVFSISIDSGVWLVPADGGAPARKISPPGLWQIFWISWSPDGRRLAFIGQPNGSPPASGSTGSDLWVMERDGADARPLTTEGRASGKPRWSPDGQLVAYQVRAPESGDGSETDVEVVRPDGTGRRTVARQAQLAGFLRRAP